MNSTMIISSKLWASWTRRLTFFVLSKPYTLIGLCVITLWMQIIGL